MNNVNLNRGDFNIDFNKNFEKEKELTIQLNKQKEKDRIDKLNQESQNKPKSIYELSVTEILINLKDTWFELIDDLLQGKFNINTFTKNSRLFYIGITLIVIVMLLYLYSLFTHDAQNTENDKIIKIYHIHSKDQSS